MKKLSKMMVATAVVLLGVVASFADDTPVFTASGEVSFSDETLWSGGEVPSGGDIVIQVTSDTTIDNDAARTFTNVEFTGAGRIAFTGAALTATAYYVNANLTYAWRFDEVGLVNIRDGATLFYDDGRDARQRKFIFEGGSTFYVNAGRSLSAGNCPSFTFLTTIDNPIIFVGGGRIDQVPSGKTAYGTNCFMLDFKVEDWENVPFDQDFVLVQNQLTNGLPFAEGNFSDFLPGRLTFNVSANQVTARRVAYPYLRNFTHYDFNGGTRNVLGSGAAADSRFLLTDNWDSLSPTVATPSRGAGAMVLLDETIFPMLSSWKDSKKNATISRAFLDKGEATVVSVCRPLATDNRVILSFGQFDAPPGIEFLVIDDNTLRLTGKRKNNQNVVLGEISEIEDLTTIDHIVVARFSPTNTTFIVDDKQVTTEVAFTEKTSNICGFGYSHRGSKRQGGEGCYLDDICVYDFALTDEEIEAVLSAYNPSLSTKILTATGVVSFNDPGNWKCGFVPQGGIVSIEVTGDTTVNLTSSCSYDSIFITGSGSIAFTGDTLKASQITVQSGVVYRPRANEAEILTIQNGAAMDVKDLGSVFSGEVFVVGDGVDGSGVLFNSSATAHPRLTSVQLMGDAAVTVAEGFDWGFGARDGHSVVLNLVSQTLTKLGNGNLCVDRIDTVKKGKIVVESGTFTLGDVLIPESGSDASGTEIVVKKNATLAYQNTLSATGLNVTFEAGSEFALDAAVALNNNNSPKVVFYPNKDLPIVISGAGSMSGINGNNCLLVYTSILEESLVDENLLAEGSAHTLIQNNLSGGSFEANDFVLKQGSRFVATVEPSAVSCVLKNPTTLIHYDFDGGIENVRGFAAAMDSEVLVNSFNNPSPNAMTMPSSSGRGNAVLVSGDADHFFLPWWTGINGKGRNYFDAGILTVVMVCRPIATDNRILWTLGQFDTRPAVALVIENDNTLAVRALMESYNNRLLASVTNIPRLTEKDHFIVVKFTPSGTTLIVDELRDSSDIAFNKSVSYLSGIGYQHRGSIASTQVADGFWLDDWRLYLAELSDAELAAIRSSFSRQGFRVIVR